MSIPGVLGRAVVNGAVGAFVWVTASRILLGKPDWVGAVGIGVVLLVLVGLVSAVARR